MKDVAIIGIGLTLPYANDINELWYILKNGIDCLNEMPLNRQIDLSTYYDNNNDSINNYLIPHGSYLDNIDCFDYEFFNMEYNEAVLINPVQRLMLQTIWKAFEDAGLKKDQIKGSNTGIYIGYSGGDEYKKYAVYDKDYLKYQKFQTGYISKYFDLKGNSIKINTACSSSLVAVHEACQAIRSDEISMAVVGGVRLSLFPTTNPALGIESSDGRTRSFDNSADGVGGGEGIITILLKSLPQAVSDKDHIHGIIKGSACNQDGTTVSISAPNREAQTQVIRKAWESADINPNTITYIEAHGTGTELGDVVEIEGITKAFEQITDKRQFCAIGSIKSNYGHLEAAAGILGLVKCALSLQHKQIPPTINFSRPNKNIPFHLSPVYVNSYMNEWIPEKDVYRCGVSSFGFSGTNCHVVLEKPPEYVENEKSLEKQKNYIFTISAKTKNALKSLIEKYIVFDYETNNILDVCYTANLFRSHYYYRLAIIISSGTELVDKLKDVVLNFSREKISERGIYHNLFEGYGASNYQHSIVNQDNSLITDIKYLETICNLYVDGNSIPWEEVYKNISAKKISLPPYQFENNRCWIDMKNENDSWEEKEFLSMLWEHVEGDTLEDIYNKEAVIFHIGDTAGKSVAEFLRDKGLNTVEVVLSDEYKVINETHFQIGENLQDFSRILNHINIENNQDIIFVCSELSDMILTESEQSIRKGLHYLYYLSKTMSQLRNTNINLFIVSRNTFYIDSQELNTCYGNSAFYGLGKGIQSECHNITCKFIDIDADVSPLLRELQNGNYEYAVAYRKNKRYIQKLSTLSLKPQKSICFKTEGIYLIFGGLGNIGIEIAHYIAINGGKNIALINRTGFPAKGKWHQIISSNKAENQVVIKKIRKLIQIEKSGAVIQIDKVDITKKEQLELKIKEYTNNFGRINGLFQCTGVGVGQEGISIVDSTIELLDQAIASKINGTFNLLDITKDMNYDFFTALSSPITVTGGINSSGYIAANAFVDTIVDYGKFNNKNISVLSLAPFIKTIKQYDTKFNEELHLFKPMDTLYILNSLTEAIKNPCKCIIAGNINYGSYLFKMQDELPFSFSGKLIEKYKSFEQSVRNNYLKDDKAIEEINIIGENNLPVDEVDRLIASILCSFLGYTEINLNKNFYEIGGDSLIAIKVISTLNQKMNIKAVVSDILKHPVLKNFIKIIKTKYLYSNNNGETCDFKDYEEQEYYPVSSSQKRLFLLNQREKDISGWNISYIMEVIEGKLDTDKLNAAFIKLINRHEALRTSFGLVKGEVVQFIHDNVEFNVGFTEGAINIDKFIKKFTKPFALNKAPLMWAEVVTTEDNKTYLIFSLHHIISDEVTMGIIIKELVSLYRGKILHNNPVQYKEFAKEQNNQYYNGRLGQEEEYWLQVFNEKIKNQKLYSLYSEQESNQSGGRRLDFELEQEIVSKITSLSREYMIMSYWYLMAAFNILISKYLNSPDVIIGVTTTGRYNTKYDNTIGMFVNVLPLRSYVDKNITFVEFLDSVKNNIIAAYENQKYPYDRLVEKLSSEHKINLQTNISFQMHKILFSEIYFGDGVKLLPVDYPYKASNQDILLEFYEKDGRMIFQITYNTPKFTQETINKLIIDFKEIIKSVTDNPYIKLSEMVVENDNIVQNMLEDFKE